MFLISFGVESIYWSLNVGEHSIETLHKRWFCCLPYEHEASEILSKPNIYRIIYDIIQVDPYKFKGVRFTIQTVACYKESVKIPS